MWKPAGGTGSYFDVSYVSLSTPIATAKPGTGAAADRPSESNSGPKVGTVFTPTLGFSAASNKTYENLEVFGQISVPSGVTNVKIRNCKIHGGNDYGISIATNSSFGANVLTNSTFDTSLSGWIDWGNSTWLNGQLRVGPGSGGRAQDKTAIKGGIFYRVNALARVHLANDRAWIGVTFYDAAGAAIANGETKFIVPYAEKLQQFIQPVLAPANAASARVWIWKDAGGVGSYVTVDNLAFAPVGNVEITNNEIYDVGSAGITGDNFVARYNRINRSGGDGIKPIGNAIIEYNYIHELGWQTIADSLTCPTGSPTGSSTCPHADGIQIRAVSNILIRKNFIFMPGPGDQIPGGGEYAFPNGYITHTNRTVLQQLAGSSNIVLDSNWLWASNDYNVQMKDSLAQETMSVVNNIFYSGMVKSGLGLLDQSLIFWANNVDQFGKTVNSSDR